MKGKLRRYETGTNWMLGINMMGLWLYACLIGSSDLPALLMFCGINVAIICIVRFDEIKKELTPRREPDELNGIIRRMK